MRGSELATDAARAIPVIVHALDALATDAPYDAVMMLQPTTPFREGGDIDTAIDLLVRTNAEAVISVTPVGGTHPARMKYVEDGLLIDPPFAEAFENQSRQELRPMVIRNGAVYLTRTAVLRAGSFKGTRCAGLEMPETRSVNIDTAADLAYAEWLLSRRSGQ
jgi:CMP-N-acetylneuraminic acid synthetase